MLPAFTRRLRLAVPWVVYGVAALACSIYVDLRAALIPARGEWYSEHNFVLLQVQAFLKGRLALRSHPTGTGLDWDWDWGRGGMHQAWGLGIPILSTPFHLAARAVGAPGFPENLLFLVLYFATAVVFARALHKASGGKLTTVLPTAAATVFVMVFPTFVGLVSARFLIYEQTIAEGALFTVLLLAGLLFVFDRSSPARLVALGAAAGFSILVRPPLAVYGGWTLLLALVIARRQRLGWRPLASAVAVYLGVTALYFVGNTLRFGAPFNLGYENSLSGPFVNRLARWGVSFAKVPFLAAAREMFVTLFLLKPVTTPFGMGTLPPAVAPYALGERWREYYTPTFDLPVLAVWVTSTVWVCARVVKRQLWQRARDLGGELPTLLGAWALAPALVLFVFYARIGNWVTRYATDMFPAFAAAALCVAAVIADRVGQRSRVARAAAQLALVSGALLYVGTRPEGVPHQSQPMTAENAVARRTAIEEYWSRSSAIPTRYRWGPRPYMSIYLQEWRYDGSFESGTLFAMKYSPCLSFTFGSPNAAWSPEDSTALADFRATADSDHLVRCGDAAVDGESRHLTMCEPHPPPYLLDGARLYSIAVLDDQLRPFDRLRLRSIDPAPSCP